MNKYDKKRLAKMFEKIDQFWLFQNLLATKYGIKSAQIISLYEAKTDRIWDLIRFNTKSDFQISLKKLYDTNNCYQISKKVYSTINNSFLGELYLENAKSATYLNKNTEIT